MPPECVFFAFGRFFTPIYMIDYEIIIEKNDFILYIY